MMHHIGIGDSQQIRGTLYELSDHAHVDDVKVEIVEGKGDEPFELLATFECEHIGKCFVSKRLMTVDGPLLDTDLQQLAELASTKFDNVMLRLSWAAVFNVEVEEQELLVPDGFSLRFEKEEELN